MVGQDLDTLHHGCAAAHRATPAGQILGAPTPADSAEEQPLKAQKMAVFCNRPGGSGLSAEKELTTTSASAADEGVLKTTSVSGSILAAFFDELAAVETLAEIAAPLRKLVLEDGVFAEPAIKAAMFPNAP